MQSLPVEIIQLIVNYNNEPREIRAIELTCRWLKNLSRQRTHVKCNIVSWPVLARYPKLLIVDGLITNICKDTFKSKIQHLRVLINKCLCVQPTKWVGCCDTKRDMIRWIDNNNNPLVEAYDEDIIKCLWGVWRPGVFEAKQLDSTGLHHLQMIRESRRIIGQFSSDDDIARVTRLKLDVFRVHRSGTRPDRIMNELTSLSIVLMENIEVEIVVNDEDTAKEWRKMATLFYDDAMTTLHRSLAKWRVIVDKSNWNRSWPETLVSFDDT